MARRPTIHELEQLLESEEDTPIEILPNGEIRARGGSDAAERGYKKPLTMRKTSAVSMGGRAHQHESGKNSPRDRCGSAVLRLCGGPPDR